MVVTKGAKWGEKELQRPNSRICLKEISGFEYELCFCGILLKIERCILLEKEVVAKRLAQSQLNKANEYYIKLCHK